MEPMAEENTEHTDSTPALTAAEDDETHHSSTAKTVPPTVKSMVSVAKSVPSIAVPPKEQYSRPKFRMRKRSLGLSMLSGIQGFKRPSQTMAVEFRRPYLTYLPTFQLGPRVKFDHYTAESIMNRILDEKFTNHKYEVTQSIELTQTITTEVLHRVRTAQYVRYRIIAVVTIGQLRAQGYFSTISFIWDSERDVYAEVHRENGSAFIQAIVFAVYLD